MGVVDDEYMAAIASGLCERLPAGTWEWGPDDGVTVMEINFDEDMMVVVEPTYGAGKYEYSISVVVVRGESTLYETGFRHTTLRPEGLVGALMATLESQGVVPDSLLKEMVDGVFLRARQQADYIVGLYAAIIPMWDEVESVHGYPEVSPSTWHYIADKARAFDRQNHPGCLPGGAWLNSGFSADENRVTPWKVWMDNVEIEYEEECQ